ncbi:hypothetical protein O181_133624 [Austropuccinia psidii MF-1]|uniref:Uncharacterized protein n=1 Tax=Austropuccinia psidii MF-1 TaxID=1389203 RepID=A0A9Q3L6Y6_9BASI|nr:hypothetical protein [Austropuccinia psidii MF-1]
MEGVAPSRRGGVNSRSSRSFSGLLDGYESIPKGPRSRLGDAEDEEGEKALEEEDSEEAGVATALAGAPEASKASNLAHSNKTLVSQDEHVLLKMMKKLTKLIGKLTQEVAPRDNSKSPAFRNPSIKAPDSFDGTQAHKLRGFIKFCQLIFHNDPKHSFCDRKNTLY